MKRVTILRSVPGGGKSRYAQLLSYDPGNQYPVYPLHPNPRCLIVSADDSHVIDGQYRFDPKRAGQAHSDCLNKFDLATRADSEFDHVVVDNTNTTAWEIAPYYQLATARGWDVKVVTLLVDDPRVCFERQTHGVPWKTFWGMYQNLLTERLPAHWNHEFV